MKRNLGLALALTVLAVPSLAQAHAGIGQTGGATVLAGICLLLA